jgi:hypothetical protein
VKPRGTWGVKEKKIPKKKPTWAEERKKKLNLNSPPWLAQGHGGTKTVHHPSTLVHWWVLVHFGQATRSFQELFYKLFHLLDTCYGHLPHVFLKELLG